MLYGFCLQPKEKSNAIEVDDKMGLITASAFVWGTCYILLLKKSYS